MPPPFPDGLCLASHLLSRSLRRLNRDWPLRYGHEVQLVETFVDRSRFAGRSPSASAAEAGLHVLDGQV